MLVFLLGGCIPCRIRNTNKQTKQSQLCSVQRRPYLYGYSVLVRYVAHPLRALPILLLFGSACGSFNLFAWHEFQHVSGIILVLFLLQHIMMQSLKNFLIRLWVPITCLYSVKWKNDCELWTEKDDDAVIAYIKVLSQNLYEGIEENHGKPQFG